MIRQLSSKNIGNVEDEAVQEDENEVDTKENEETRLQALTALQDIESDLIDFKNK